MKLIARSPFGGSFWKWGLILASLGFLWTGCYPEDEYALEELLIIEAEGEDLEAADSPRADELRGEIRQLRSEIQRHEEASRQLGTYWRLLGVEYLSLGMMGPAMEAFEEALGLSPESGTLNYYLGLASAHRGKRAFEEALQVQYFRDAERAYRRALEIRPRYFMAWYGLAVLYHFELQDQEEARAAVEQALSINGADPSGLFLAGRIYMTLGLRQEALAAYRRILQENHPEELRERAQNNISRILGEGQ